MDDEFKQILKKFSKLLEDFSITLRSYIEYEEAVYKAFGEEINPLEIDKIFFNRKFLDVIRGNPKAFGEFMIIMLDLAELFEKNKDLNKLSPEQKRVVADKLAELAKSLEKFVGEV